LHQIALRGRDVPLVVMSQDAPQIELRKVRKSYGERNVLDGADLVVGRGEILAIMGRSGSGKSTLLKLVGGIDIPDDGAVLHGGRDMNLMNDRERTRFRRQSLGFVFQFFNLIPTLTVSENIGLPLALNGFRGAAASGRIQELLDDLGLTECADRFPDELSGGEQQRVAIARALAHKPGLIIADEPTGNLDSETADQVSRLLRDTCRRAGTTLIVATHSTEAASIADRVVRIRSGHIEELPP
jgi:putative ABC transport system ATP-binding protein